ncbi:hypothetical protein M3Y99_00480600 [Aphelenchoides fujianensis]|nr:hypothetical protein M3Y99_00480600 [Aphelenchoides fujianensis]
MAVALLPTNILFHLSTVATFVAVVMLNELRQRFHPSFTGASPTEELSWEERLERVNRTRGRTAVSGEEVILFSHRYACGGGLVSTTAASLVSIPCAYEKLHTCCQQHDLCYDSRLGQETCDEFFCSCLSNLESEGAYCDLFTHFGLCASTRLLGHFFYEHGEFNRSAFELLGDAGSRLLAAVSAASIASELSSNGLKSLQ